MQAVREIPDRTECARLVLLRNESDKRKSPVGKATHGIRLVTPMVLAVALIAPSIAVSQTAPETPVQQTSVQQTPVQEAQLDSGSIADGASDADSLKANTSQFFKERVTPFLKNYCIDCHQNKRPTEAGINFSPAFKDPGHAAFSLVWKKAGARVKAHDMPPEGMEQPTADERQMFASWIDQVKYLSPKDPGPFVIRRLTKVEYANTLQDLFDVDTSIADRLPAEVSGEGYLNSMSPLQMELYVAIAQDVVDRALTNEGSQSTELQDGWLGGLAAKSAPNDIELHKHIQELATKVYRRPPSEHETEVLLEVYDLALRNDLSHSAAMRLTIKAMLVSPQFLFITPTVPVDSSDEIVEVDDYQLASRLSYLLWSTMPDQELMELASHGTLSNPDVLEVQVRRLLSDSRSRALFDGFGAQWLGVGEFGEKVFDTEMFPQMTDSMRLAMYDEVRLLFEDVVRKDRNVNALLTSDFTFLNHELAALYGLDDQVSGSKMRKVLLEDRNRGGILGMAGILAATSFPNRTSAVKRGVWVLERVLGEQVPSAPPDVPALETQAEQTAEKLTLREQIEMHRKDPVCANCHNLLDPIGFGLENFDAIGRWREQDENGETIDASGELPDGNRFATPEELKLLVAGQSEAFTRNLLQRLLAYALCRRLEGYDEVVVDQLMEGIAADGYKMQSLITAVVTSYPFRYRRLHAEGHVNHAK